MGVEVSTDSGVAQPVAVLERTGLTNLPTLEISNLWTWFRSRSSRLALALEDFAALCAEAKRGNGTNLDVQVSAVAGKAFAALDVVDRGVLDGLELFSALTLLSRGSLEERTSLLFAIFDLASRGKVDRASLGLLVDRAASGLERSCVCLKLLADDWVPQAMVCEAFQGKGPDEEMTRDEFRDWWWHDRAVRCALSQVVAGPDEDAGLPSEDAWRHADYVAMAQELRRVEEEAATVRAAQASAANSWADAAAGRSALVSAEELRGAVLETVQEEKKHHDPEALGDSGGLESAATGGSAGVAHEPALRSSDQEVAATETPDPACGVESGVGLSAPSEP